MFDYFRSRSSKVYRYGVSVVEGATKFNQYASDHHKLTLVLSNPAVLKVFSLQCDLFSMGKVTVMKNEKEIEDDPFLTFIAKPNPFTETQTQFLWDYMFFNMLGTSYTYVHSSIVDRKDNKMYFLNPGQIKWPDSLEKNRDKFIFSDADVKNINKTTITYKYLDGTKFEFPLDRLVISHDLTNSVGNFYKGPSRLDALVKVISNNEYTLDAENINLRYSGKFLVGSDKAVGQSIRVGMTDDEKTDIEQKIDTDQKSVWSLQSMVKIQRFVSDMASLQLKDQYLHQYFVIGSMYNIPRDVLEAYNSSTYENQEKARAAHTSYCLEPKGEQFMDSFENHFGYPAQGKNITISWKHLPFMQIFEKDRVDVKKTTIEVLNSLLALGVSIEQANEYLGTEFEIEEPKETENGEAQTNPAGSQETESGEGEATEGAGADKKIRRIV